jgi:hypothetical protein
MARKVALCVGQNEYAAHTGITPLRGCVNDAMLIGEMLRFAGFDVRQIHDKGATQQGVLGRFETEVARLREGDYFVFWNSSHGYQVKDRSGDELHDGLDEAVCTYDTDVRDPLTDDKIARIFARANPRTTIFLGSDSCHSGTLTRDFAEGLRQNGNDPKHYQAPRLWVPTEDVRFRQGLVDFDMWKLIDDEPAQKETLEPSPDELRTFGRLGHPPPEVRHLLLSGCKPEQVSWDAHYNGQNHGAMSFNFAKAVLRAWKSGKAITYAEAHQQTVDGVHERFQQDPQLEGPRTLADEPVFGFVP